MKTEALEIELSLKQPKKAELELALNTDNSRVLKWLRKVSIEGFMLFLKYS